jgi:hypothetical protein
MVKLVDGVTQFGLSDVIESPTDPRSPLRVAAICREFKVPTKFTTIESMLAKSTSGGATKRKLYTNDRVREAQVKEKEKKERMDQDEAERLVELFQYQQQQQQQDNKAVR